MANYRLCVGGDPIRRWIHFSFYVNKIKTSLQFLLQILFEIRKHRKWVNELLEGRFKVIVSRRFDGKSDRLRSQWHWPDWGGQILIMITCDGQFNSIGAMWVRWNTESPLLRDRKALEGGDRAGTFKTGWIYYPSTRVWQIGILRRI